MNPMRPKPQTLVLEDGSLLSDDPARLQFSEIHHFLSKEAYWSKHIPAETLRKAMQNSYQVGISQHGHQLAYMRVVTDYATFAYLCDVYVAKEVRGKGYSKKLLAFLMQQSWMKQLRRLLLATKDAHGLYESFGFQKLSNPDDFMTLSRPHIYGDCQNPCL